jgi:hypothetical protein
VPGYTETTEVIRVFQQLEMIMPSPTEETLCMFIQTEYIHVHKTSSIPTLARHMVGIIFQAL